MYEEYPIKYQTPVNEQYYSDESLYEALSGFFYAFEIKSILKKAKTEDKKERSKYIEPLEELRDLAPKSKLEELENVIKKMKDHVKPEEETNQ